jgi:predicted ATPase
MKLIQAQVQNFRSVEDSEKFSVDPQITCLVGKNESGKTNILSALYRLNPIFDDSNFDKQKDYPRRHLSDYAERHSRADPTVITTWWCLSATEKDAISAKFGEHAFPGDTIKIHKGYSSKELWCVEIDEPAIIKHLLDTSGLHAEEKDGVGAVTTVAALKTKVAALPEATPRKVEFSKRLDADIPDGNARRGVMALLSLPKFLLFSQYQRMQGQVSLDGVQARKSSNTLTEDDQVFIALCDMASVTLEQAASVQEFEGLVSSFEGASNKISAEIFRYWSQNKFLKVIFRLDLALSGDPPPFNTGRVFRTRIDNRLHEVTVPFDDRSTGFVWFFSFLALFSQVKKRHTGQIVILLDEPGLSLHGKAQADLLRYFKERLAPNHQVLYTTHSPFMVPSDNLLAARTVEDVVIFREGEPPEVHGTKVGSQVLSTDRDTLFPLQAALGYEITQSLFVGEHTLLVEGPGDLIYLQALSEIMRTRGLTQIDHRWTICPARGVDKVSSFMSLFGGNKLHVAVLTDFATGQKKKIDDLRRSTLLRDGHVLTMDAYTDQGEADTEDLLGTPLYAHIINSLYDLSGAQVFTPSNVGLRVVKQAEEHFKTLPPPVPEFDHYAPAVYFAGHTSDLFAGLPEADKQAALRRFERLFTDLNALLPAR